MAEAVATTILITSFFGMSAILFRKIPSLMELPFSKEEVSLVLKVQEKAKEFNSLKLKPFSAENFLQKVLLRLKVLILKTENKISYWLEGLQQRSRIQSSFPENYWQELKKIKNKTEKRKPKIESKK